MAPTRCNPIWPPCIHEIHTIIVGLAVGVIFSLLWRQSKRWGGIFVTVAMVLAWVAPIHGVLKPWYVFGGLLFAVVLANVVSYIRTTY